MYRYNRVLNKEQIINILLFGSESLSHCHCCATKGTNNTALLSSYQYANDN